MSRTRRLSALACAGLLLVGTSTATASADAQRTTTVSTAEELAAAVAKAVPGDTIQLAAGGYEGAFFATAKGTAQAPITLTGPRDAVLSNPDGECVPAVAARYCGYGLHLGGAVYWKLSGFSMTRSAKGIVLDGSNQVTIDGVEVSAIRAEAVHFRSSSSDNVIKNSSIHDTGQERPEYGEAVYIGSAKSNWRKFGANGGPDRSDRNQVLDNVLGPYVSAEHVDIKEGTERGVVRGNRFDGHGLPGENYADSSVDVKGNDYHIEDNIGPFDGAGALVDGYQTHRIVDGYGCGNRSRATTPISAAPTVTRST